MSGFDDKTAIIPKGTIINGNIEISGKLEMYGTINGNITSDSRVNICGEVTGDIDANDIYARDSFIEGNITCKQGAVIRDNSVVLGDINANNLLIDGAVQGSIDVAGNVTVGEKAIVDSFIKAKSFQANYGAALNGRVDLCYADIDISDVFPSDETKEESAKPADVQPIKATGKLKKSAS